MEIVVFLCLIALAKFVIGVGWEICKAALNVVGLLPDGKKDRNEGCSD